MTITIAEVDEKSLQKSVIEYQESAGSPTVTRNDNTEDTMNPE